MQWAATGNARRQAAPGVEFFWCTKLKPSPMAFAARTPSFLDVGDGAVSVELGNSIDETINRQVVALDAALQGTAAPGIVETIPTYRSLLVAFDPELISRDEIRALVLANWPPARGASDQGTRWVVPVAYGGSFGEDLDTVAGLHGLTRDDVIAIHSGAEYRVYMIGFAPGFAYLGGLPETLHTSRRSEPRLKTPPGSVSIGGQQAAVSPPLEVPSGWHLLGRTPVRSYDPGRERPFLFNTGDRVRFRPISAAEYGRLAAAADAGAEVAEAEILHG